MIQRSLRDLMLRVMLLVVVGLVAGARPALAQEPPPRPTLTPTQTPTSTPLPVQTPTALPVQTPTSAPSAPTPLPAGRIVGTVINRTTNAPAPGITVAVGDVTVTTDANGNYERAGLPAGSYVVALVLTAAQGTPEQGPITLELAQGATAVQHLAFRSPLAATVVPATPTTMPPTAVPPMPTPSTPVTLPDTGATGGIGVGLPAVLLLLAGIGVWSLTERSRRNVIKRR
jgi:hypothetical protein